ncbi:MAG: LysR family transcriptional regulator [Rhodoferax sp.]|uniref:LysR family transcriptional regulator n=1 Tax=Rhodoferax sp. TaxID=50421 RepID=UPI0026377879|nr:LysR family transcriptional regulator [Rhodoferax sp.]MDD5333903.1 LysR family transcriptional regulator [Rhodoferax sp.]
MRHETAVDLNAVLVFAAVAQAGGFTAAAERLGLSKARVSLEVGRLEARLGVGLLTRTTRRVLVTEAGQKLLDECVPLLRNAQETLAGLGQRDLLQGTLRIACTVEHAVQSLAGTVARFARLHPQLQIELRSSDMVVNLVAEGIDVAIRMGWLRDSTLRATRLGTFGQWVVASPDYLRRSGLPQAPEDLAQMDWVTLTLLPTPLTWHFTGAQGELRTVRTASRLRCDSAATLRALLLEGAGVSVMDQLSTDELVRRGDLIRLLPEWRLPEGGIYAVYAPGRHIQPKVRAFIDFYVAHLNASTTPEAR